MAAPHLFKPLKIGNIEVKHRIAMAPLTRLRAGNDRVPTPMMKEYYGQRASVPGTLIVSEGTFVSPQGSGGFRGAPGIWSKEQIAAWRTITDEVHRKGCFIFCQLAALGRSATTEAAREEGVSITGASAIPIDKDSPVPRTMTVEEIKEMIQDFVTAGENAISAGFDGVECHGANGFLIDQFTQDVSNKRDDEYGGSVENRSRFVHDILKALANTIGAERVALRLSPWSAYQSMRMKDPVPQFTDVIKKADQLNLAYLHLIEARDDEGAEKPENERLDFAYQLFNGPLLVAGGYTPAEARKLVDEEYPDKDIVVIFGRYFISNPDFVYRVKEGLELSPYDRSTFYTRTSVGYLDYPFSEKYLASQNA